MKLITQENCPHCGTPHSWKPNLFKKETNWEKQLKICLCKECTETFSAMNKKAPSITHKGVNSQKYWASLKTSVEKAIQKPKFA